METSRKLQLTTIVNRNPALHAADMDDEKVMMHLEKGKYYSLNSIGSIIWDIIETPNSVKSIIVILMSEYDVDRATCENSVMDFLNRLLSEDIIAIVS